MDDAMAQGAVQGGSAGMALGPWGAAAGALIGGIAGKKEGQRKAAEMARREGLDNAYASIQAAYSPFVRAAAQKAPTGEIAPGAFGSLVSGATSGLNAYQGLQNSSAQNALNQEKLKQLQQQNKMGSLGLGNPVSAGQPIASGNRYG